MQTVRAWLYAVTTSLAAELVLSPREAQPISNRSNHGYGDAIGRTEYTIRRGFISTEPFSVVCLEEIC